MCRSLLEDGAAGEPAAAAMTEPEPTTTTALPPLLSIVVPTRDRPAALRACLESIARQGGDVAVEVIVVDDGGAPGAAEIPAALHERLPIRCHRQDNAGPAAARNAGARLATGRWLVFLDDDCTPEPGWLAGIATRCARDPEAMIGGAVRNALADDRYAACHQLLLDYLHVRLNPTAASAAFCASCNFAVPAAGFRAIGGFDPGFPYPAAEDRDLCDRWRLSGRTIVHAPEVLVQHAHAMSARLFWRQHFGYGRGACRLHRLRRLREPGGRVAERPGFYASLLLYPLRSGPMPRTPGLLPLMALSQLATACGYVAEALGDRRPLPRETTCFS